MPYKDKKKQAEYQREWIRRRRATWLAENGPCITCGSWEDLEVDHIDPATKSMQPAAIWSRSKENQERELAKCQVLCKPCHLKKTAEQTKAKTEATHNPATMYYRGCRCEECKEDQRKRNAKRVYDPEERRMVYRKQVV